MKNQTTTAITPDTLADTDTQALLISTVGEQRYGLPITSVVRIVEIVTITPLPNAPSIIQGIINVQGKVVPAMELRHRFGLPRQAYGLHTPIILAEMNGDGQMLGLIVDTVEDVIHVPQAGLEITEAFVPAELMDWMAAQAAHLAGVAKVDRQMIPVLEVRALLTQTEQTELSQALANDLSLA
jgi:purine-binding chemotaxis protein CheW